LGESLMGSSLLVIPAEAGIHFLFFGKDHDGFRLSPE